MNTELTELFEIYDGNFLQPVIFQDRFFEVDTNAGIEWVEQALIGKTTEPSKAELHDFIEGTRVYSCRLVDGYGAYLSAPGYLDRTELCVFGTEMEAIQHLDRTELCVFGTEMEAIQHLKWMKRYARVELQLVYTSPAYISRRHIDP